MDYLRREVPPPNVIRALVKYIKKHGGVGADRRLKLGWSVILNASHGLPIRSDDVTLLEMRLLGENGWSK